MPGDLAQQLFEMYLLPADTGRIEVIDKLLDEAGVHDSKDRDKILLFGDRAHVKLEAHKKDLARLLLRVLGVVVRGGSRADAAEIWLTAHARG